MRISICIGHPGHVHFFKNAIRIWEQKNHTVKCFVLMKEMNLELVNHYGFDYEILDSEKKTLLGRIPALLIRDYKLLKLSQKFNPDIIVGIANVYGSHVAKLLDIPSIWFHDSEATHFVKKLTKHFASCVVTPNCYSEIIKETRHIMYPGYHELAYLHPNRFEPDGSVLDEAGISPGENFFVVRFGLWTASHDYIHQTKFNSLHKIYLVKQLSKIGKVFISSGEKLPKSLEQFSLKISKHKFHDLIAFSKLVVTDSQTTTAEAGELGVPAVRCNSYVGRKDDMSYIIDLERNYDLVYSYSDPYAAIRKIMELANRNTKTEWSAKRDKMLKDKIDVTSFIERFVANYPESINELREGKKPYRNIEYYGN